MIANIYVVITEYSYLMSMYLFYGMTTFLAFAR
jgi:hypothetical protein